VKKVSLIRRNSHL